MILKRTTLVIGEGKFKEFYGWDSNCKGWVTSLSPINILNEGINIEDLKSVMPDDIDPKAKLVNIEIIVHEE